MNLIKRTFTLFFLSFLMLSCSNEENVGIELSFPTEAGIEWRHAIYKYSDTDTTAIGTVVTRNMGLESFQNRPNVLNLRRSIALDSLVGTIRPITVRSTYMQKTETGFDLFADNYFDVFDRMLTNAVLDTLSRGGSGEDYQRFSFIVPGWVNWLAVQNNPDIPINVHPSYKVYLDFYYRDIRLTGFVTVFTESRFDDFDVVRTESGQQLLTYRYLMRSYYDFSLERNGQVIPQFRLSSDLYQWIHESAGIIQRDRKPFELYIPQVPSRWPIVLIPGEIWKLSSISGLELK